MNCVKLIILVVLMPMWALSSPIPLGLYGDGNKVFYKVWINSILRARELKVAGNASFSGNVELNGITKAGSTVSWPSMIGAAGTFLASDGVGNLTYSTPAGSGNVATTLDFTTNNALLRVDSASGVHSIKESNIVVDTSDNITGINQLTATLINADVNGIALGNLPLVGGTLTGTLVVSAGTAAAPSVQFDGSINTGISAETANTLSFDIEGTEQMTVSSSGIAIPAVTANRAVTTDATNTLVASSTTDTQIGYLSTTTSDVQTQLTNLQNSKVAKAGDTMTGTLIVPAGSATTPSVQFTGSTNTGISAAAANIISFDTNGTERMSISSSGVIIPTVTANRVVTTNATNTLVASATTDIQLGYLSTTTSDVQTQLTNLENDKVAKNGDTLSGTLIFPAGSATTPSMQFTGSTNTGFSAPTANVISCDIDGTEQMNVSATGVVIPTVVANRAVTTDATNTLVASATTDIQLGYLSTTTSDVQTQINGKVAKAGDTMTGALVVPAGSAGIPSVQFTGSTNTGISAATANIISFDTNGTERMSISSGGVIIPTVAANRAVTTNGSNALVASSTTDTQLGYLSTTTSDVQTQLNGKVAKTGDTMTGTLVVPAGSAALPSVKFSGSTNTGISAATANTLSFDTDGAERMSISSSGVVAIPSITAHRVVTTNASNQLVASATTDTQLGYLSTTTSDVQTQVNGKVAKAGDTMTGTLIVPAGSAATPSVQFSGSTNTGISAATANTLSFDINGSEKASMSSTDINLIARVVLKNLLCNQALQTNTITATGQTTTALATTSLLRLSLSGGSVATHTVVFPPSPTNGQMFTIMLGTGGTARITALTNTAGTGSATFINPITRLDPNAAPSTTSATASVTYIYDSTTNIWYRYAIG